ncbi:hypothetical protein HK096_009100 [Nowakowskiella sp. JEL0078]|nr:hypothetical protein HK096_009100 [Nowakowskiella sp. JEL0078]
MQEIVSKQVRSVILASGTLSPLDSFASEMGISFKYQLENPHVVKQEQVFVGVVTQGPARHKLNSSYATRDSPDYISDLGNCIVNFTRIVPDGVLVFFPSYGVMSNCIEYWKNSNKYVPDSKSLWERIAQNKSLFIEPKTKFEFNETISKFYEKVNSTKNGAVFFAVCRGKASEGIDFSDSKGRAVIICGLPFPAAKDPKNMTSKFISGNDWYMQQAIRAVNQAIGRVIRHKNDFGAILLCDERFSTPLNIGKLSMWIRPFVNIYVKSLTSFGEVQGLLAKFFKNNRECHQISRNVVPELRTESVNLNIGGHLRILQDKFFKDLQAIMDTSADHQHLHKEDFEGASRTQMKKFSSGVFGTLSQYKAVESVENTDSSIQQLNKCSLSLSSFGNLPKLSTELTSFDVETNSEDSQSKLTSLNHLRKKQLLRINSNSSITSLNSLENTDDESPSKRQKLLNDSELNTEDNPIINRINTDPRKSDKTFSLKSEEKKKSDIGNAFVAMARDLLSLEQFCQFQTQLRNFKARIIGAELLYLNVFRIFASAQAVRQNNGSSDSALDDNTKKLMKREGPLQIVRMLAKSHGMIEKSSAGFTLDLIILCVLTEKYADLPTDKMQIKDA